MTTASPLKSAEPRPNARHWRPGARRNPLLIMLRQATPDDCARIARLYMIACDGVAEYAWSRIDAPGLSLLEIGERKFARDDTAYSYQNCQVAEKDGTVIGMLHSFPMRQDTAGRLGRESDPVLAPYNALRAPGSLYVSAVAVFHEHRGLGIGTRLLEEAGRRARSLGLEHSSLICFEKNTQALRLYRRLGFRELERRPVVPHPFLHYREGDAILLARPTDVHTST